MKLVNHIKFSSVMLDVLIKKGMPSHIAKPITTSLIETSLKGIDSHGINLFIHYFNEVASNRLNINPSLQFDQTSNSTALLDAQNTFGHYSGQQSMIKAIDLATENGVGIVSVSNSTHFGAAWFFTDIAARNGMIGIALTNTEPLVNAYNSKESFFGTNPFCFSAPMSNEHPFCLDMATSTVPWNKIKNYRQENMELDPKWAYDVNGGSTTDPHKANSLSSIGEYKGFGLGMVIEILCSGLSSGPLSKDISPLYDMSITQDRKISHFFLALDISKFTPVDRFEKYLWGMSAQIRSLPKSGIDDVMVAGDKEKKTAKTRTQGGIPINENKFKEFLKISKSFETTII
jgi:LDH2 family malate/lactate/ureidoglycolate dehydrogenase